MISRWLWNSHQRHKFLRAEASWDILKFRVSGIAFPGVSRGIYHHGCYVVSSQYLQHWEQYHRNVAGIPRMVRTFQRSKLVYICAQCHSKLEHGCFTILFNGAYFLLAVMVERDESSRQRMANWPAVLAGYWPLLTALNKLLEVTRIFTYTINFTAMTVEASFSNTIVRCIIEQTIW